MALNTSTEHRITLVENSLLEYRTPVTTEPTTVLSISTHTLSLTLMRVSTVSLSPSQDCPSEGLYYNISSIIV